MGERQREVKGNRSIHHGFDIIEMLVRSREPLLITEIAERLDRSVSAVHSVLKAMIDRGYVTHLGRRKGYVIGPQMTSVSTRLAQNQQLAKVAETALEALHRGCDRETCFLGRFDHEHVETILTKPSPRQLGIGPVPRFQEKLHAMAMGKVLLAFSPREKYRQWKRKIERLEEYTSNTLTSFTELERELERVRKLGYAENVEETEKGVYVLAAPVFNFSGDAVATLSVGLPVLRLNDEKRQRYKSQLTARTLALSEQLGHEQ